MNSSITSYDNEQLAMRHSTTTEDAEEEELRFMDKQNVSDTATPRRTPLSAKYHKSFAYRTFRQRTPNMLLDIMSTLKSRQSRIMEQFGDYAQFDLRCAILSLEILRNEIVENKRFKLFYDKKPDSQMWNDIIKKLVIREKNQWFSSDWLFAECYMYRRILGAFQRTRTLKDFDYFGIQKVCSTRNIIYLLMKVLSATRNLKRSRKNFNLMLKLSLWANRCDLSITKEVPNEEIIKLIEEYDKNLIVDQSEDVWRLLTVDAKPGIVDIVLDNAGFELFADLMLGEYLINAGLATKVRYHAKAIPWFISDVTAKDFCWMMRILQRHEIPEMRAFGRKLHWLKCNRKLELFEANPFWTTPYGFRRMREYTPSLYVHLSFGELVIFKGDLNYRKLIDDFNWESTTPFDKCLGGFMPTSVCALRAIKCDCYCGMPICAVEWLTEDDPNWMCTGEKGVIQLAIKPRP